MIKKEEKPYFVLEISKEHGVFYAYAKGTYETREYETREDSLERIIGDSANSLEEFHRIIKSILKDYKGHVCNSKFTKEMEEIDYIQENVLSTLIKNYNTGRWKI